MKIRIRGNSVRIRLSRSEVANFSKEGYVEEHTDFGNSKFRYVLERSETADRLSAEYKDGCITVCVPVVMVNDWATTDKVGFENRMPLPDGGELHILVEKDFKCVDNTSEDQSDNYEHPTNVC
jgi:hypothetical protein